MIWQRPMFLTVLLIIVLAVFKLFGGTFSVSFDNHEEKACPDGYYYYSDMVMTSVGPISGWTSVDEGAFDRMKKQGKLFTPDQYQEKLKELMGPEDDKTVPDHENEGPAPGEDPYAF